MTKEELIKILEEYEVFVDDDYGGSYQSIITYTKDKKISRAFTSLGALEIIDTFEKTQKEKQELIDYLKEKIDECPLNGNDEADMFYTGKMRAFQQMLSKIEKE